MIIVVILIVLVSAFSLKAKFDNEAGEYSFWKKLFYVLTLKVFDYYFKGTPTKVIMYFMRLLSSAYMGFSFFEPIVKAGVLYSKNKGFFNLWLEFQYDNTSMYITVLYFVCMTVTVCVYFIFRKNEASIEQFFNIIAKKIDKIIKLLGNMISKQNKTMEILELQQKQNFKHNIIPLQEFSDFARFNNTHDVFSYVDTEELSRLRSLIVDPANGHIRLVGLSGMGKTFLVQKAFADAKSENVFYACNANVDLLRNALSYLLIERINATIILDNCSDANFRTLIAEFGTAFRFISIHYDPNDYTNGGYNLLNLKNLETDIIIDKIIDQNKTREVSEEYRRIIKKHAGNIPFMALLLIQAFNKTDSLVAVNDNLLFEHLLDIRGQYPEEQKRVMQTLALCLPLDYDNAQSKIANYLINSPKFTPIETMINKTTLFNNVVNELTNRNLIERDSVYINMRPQPLAIWLVGEWIKKQGRGLIDTIKDLAKQEDSIKKPILESWSSRLEYMQGNKDAEDLYAELVNINGGPFANEDVICSDFGSRLILAMCTVNPVAVVNCLYSVLYVKSIKFLKDKLIGDARRNIVRTLEKLCFCDDCFEQAACLMARLAVAENEAWANNAHGQFLQLFHIALAGTESDLNARISVIQKLHRDGVEYNNLLLDAIKGAFNSSNLVRMGGAEKFGFIEKSDFHPTWNQISEYWDNLYDFLKDWIEKEPELTKTIADIICSNTRMLIHSRRPDLLFKFIDLLAPQLNYNWNEMHKALVETKNYDKVTSEIGEKILFWLEKLTPQDTIGRMRNALHDMYTKFDRGVDIIQQEEKVVLPFAEEFISNKAYLSEEVFQLLDQNNGYISWAFDAILAKDMPIDDIAAFCDYIKGYIYKQGKKFYSSFLVSIFGKLNEKQLVWPFAHQLFDEGYIDIAISIFAVTDDNVRSKLSFVMQKVSEGVIEKSYVRKYLSEIRLNKASDILAVATQLEECGADMPLLFDHISHYWYLDECYTNTELVQLYQKIILNYPLKDNDNFNYEFVHLVKSLLNKSFDWKFAKSLNVKLIKFLSFNKSLFHVEEIYEILLTDKYRDYIWADFSEALTDFDNRILFFFNVKYTIGSGFEFGEKILFSGHIAQMKQLCSDFKYGALVCAATCPIFDNADSDTGVISSFHSFVIWLIENYGNQEQVLNEFHANLNTFSWTGSSMPLIEDRRRCFKNLKQNKNLPGNVYSWIDLCLKENLNDYKREEQHEAYMRLAYGKR